MYLMQYRALKLELEQFQTFEELLCCKSVSSGLQNGRMY